MIRICENLQGKTMIHKDNMFEVIGFFKKNKVVVIILAILLFLILTTLSVNISQRRQVQSIGSAVTAIAQWNATMTETTKQFVVVTTIAKAAYTETPITISTPTEIPKPNVVPERGLNVTRDKVSTTVGIKVKKGESIDSQDNYSGQTETVLLQIIGPSENVSEISFIHGVPSDSPEMASDGVLQLIALLNLFDKDAKDWVKNHVFSERKGQVEEEIFNGITFTVRTDDLPGGVFCTVTISRK